MARSAWCYPELVSVPFKVGKQNFKAGDVIVIEEVLAASPELHVGDQVKVRGHYQLVSAPKAVLGLFVTQRSNNIVSEPARTQPPQMARVDGTQGAFELSCELTSPGDLHVSFYPVRGGEAFGGVYFASAELAKPATPAK